MGDKSPKNSSKANKQKQAKKAAAKASKTQAEKVAAPLLLRIGTPYRWRAPCAYAKCAYLWGRSPPARFRSSPTPTRTRSAYPPATHIASMS